MTFPPNEARQIKLIIQEPEPEKPRELHLKFAEQKPQPAQKITFKRAEQPAEPERMTRKDFLETWGFLQTLKDELEAKAKAAASGGAELGPQVAGDYLKMCAEISAMQEKISREAEARE